MPPRLRPFGLQLNGPVNMLNPRDLPRLRCQIHDFVWDVLPCPRHEGNCPVSGRSEPVGNVSVVEVPGAYHVGSVLHGLALQHLVDEERAAEPVLRKVPTSRPSFTQMFRPPGMNGIKERASNPRRASPNMFSRTSRSSN